LDAAGMAPPQGSVAWPPGVPGVEKRQRNQPPQRGIDTTQIPEVGFTALQVDELRDLAVRGLMLGQRMQRGSGRALQLLVTTNRHTERAHGCVTPENGGIAAQIRPLAWCGRQNSGRR